MIHRRLWLIVVALLLPGRASLAQEVSGELGLLRYVGERYARYEGSGEYFIQMGSQSPENLLAYADFDDTIDHGGPPNRLRDGLHRYQPHIGDWRPGDPTWKGGKGKGLIGALNYLAGKGMNTVYSLTMNVFGDGRETHPWTGYDERARYDVSKLAQWEIVLSHMDRLGLQLMVITQEEENEQLLGKLTTLRKLYYRELIARFRPPPRPRLGPLGGDGPVALLRPRPVTPGWSG
jgi:hypothetical protein